MGVKVREKIKGSGVWWLFISHNGSRKAKKVGHLKEKSCRACKGIRCKACSKRPRNKYTQKKETFAHYCNQWHYYCNAHGMQGFNAKRLPINS